MKVFALLAAATLGSAVVLPADYRAPYYSRVGTALPPDERFANLGVAGSSSSSSTTTTTTSGKPAELPSSWTRVDKPDNADRVPAASTVVVGTVPQHNSTMFPGMVFRPGKKPVPYGGVQPNPKSREWVESVETDKRKKTIQTRPEPQQQPAIAQPLVAPLKDTKTLAARGYSDDSHFDEHMFVSRGLESQQPQSRPLEPRQCFSCMHSTQQPPIVADRL